MRHILSWLLRIALASVFVYAGAVKTASPSRFAEEITAYRILPDTLGGIDVALSLGIFLPWLEIMVGLGILLPYALRIPTPRGFPQMSGRGVVGGAALIQVVLMAVFTVAIGSAWWRELDINCGCFGASEVKANYLWIIMRDLLILGGAAGVFWIANARDSPNAVRQSGA